MARPTLCQGLTTLVALASLVGCVPAVNPTVTPADTEVAVDVQPVEDIGVPVEDTTGPTVDSASDGAGQGCSGVAPLCPLQAGVCQGVRALSCVDGDWAACDLSVYAGHHAGYEEVEGTCDGVDNDCDGAADEGVKNACGNCGELPAEVCDGADNDCDGSTDEGVENACGDCGEVPEEVCNGQDDDCDGSTDEGVKNACGDCGEVPVEICNGQDDNCDGSTDEGVENACGDCGEVPEEVCNGQDDDCDGATDEGVSNACGECGEVPSEVDCNGVDDDCDGDTDEESFSDGVDNNCNGLVDEVLVTTSAEAIEALNWMSGWIGGVLFAPGDYVLDGEGISVSGDRFIRGTSGQTTIDLAGGHFHVKPGAYLDIDGVTISGGAGKDNKGGAFYVDDTDALLELYDVVLSGNSASWGGAIYLNGAAEAHMQRCRLTGNMATQEGGAVFSEPKGVFEVEASIFDANSAVLRGGAVSGEGALTLESVIMMANHAEDGGAVRWDGGTFTIHNVTFVENTASDDGPAIHIFSSPVGEIRSCIFTDNTVNGALANPIHGGSAATILVSHCLCDTSSCISGGADWTYAFALTNQSASYVSYSNNSTYDDNLRLAEGSPGVDDGDTSLGADSAGSGTSANDMGAYGGFYGDVLEELD